MGALLRCPYCLGELGEAQRRDELIARCASCQTPHHLACVAAHGSCTILGCGSTQVDCEGRKSGIDELAAGLELGLRPFRVRDDLIDAEPRWLRLESSLDGALEDRQLGLSLHLDVRARRGERLRGLACVHAPRGVLLSQLSLTLEAFVETELAASPSRAAQRRQTAVLSREVVLAGLGDGGLGEGLWEATLEWFGRGRDRLLRIPPGTRRWAFSLLLSSRHPSSVVHRREGERDAVWTKLILSARRPVGGALRAETVVQVE